MKTIVITISIPENSNVIIKNANEPFDLEKWAIQWQKDASNWIRKNSIDYGGSVPARLCNRLRKTSLISNARNDARFNEYIDKPYPYHFYRHYILHKSVPSFDDVLLMIVSRSIHIRDIGDKSIEIIAKTIT